MDETFDLSFAEGDEDDASDFRNIDAAIQRLAARRRTKIDVVGPFRQSKLAWNVAVYQQAILYRVVMLAKGALLAWNTHNVLACFLLIRALTETVAVFDNFERELLDSLEREDLEAMHKLVINRTFATKDGELLKDHPEILAINVMTFIDKMEKRYDLPIRSNYDAFSERCHPNSAGHHQMYSTTNHTNGTVTFSETKNLSGCLALMRAPLGLLFLFERTLDELDRATLRVAELQHRLKPVRDRPEAR